MKTFDKYQDIEQGGYAKFNGLKTFNKELKTILAIGGWNEGSTRFSSLVASPQRRQEFVKNIIKFLRQNHFDGLDLDWEYPSFRGLFVDILKRASNLSLNDTKIFQVENPEIGKTMHNSCKSYAKNLNWNRRKPVDQGIE